MRIHILGICGTFMGGLALIARQLGHKVTGSDAGIYPPMSTQLQAQGIKLNEGFNADHLQPTPDLVIIGNALSRGNPEVEAVLDQGLRYVSGPQWLAESVLYERRHVLAIAGTHGKTTTSSMLAWILEQNSRNPGFLIGGVPENFGLSARLTDSVYFVIEADEYDTAFFDKRSKFVHYRPTTLVINNLEFDHADIFDDIGDIKRQFHHLVRTIPHKGRIIFNADDGHVSDVLAMGCWSGQAKFGSNGDWQAKPRLGDCSQFQILKNNAIVAEVDWSLIGRHNMMNALAAIVAADHVGITANQSAVALKSFKNVKRRLEIRGSKRGVTVYDDFAHHPTAIAETIAALRAKVGNERIVAVLEPRSNTMRMGVHKSTLAGSLGGADEVVVVADNSFGWDVGEMIRTISPPSRLCPNVDGAVEYLTSNLQSGDHVLIMSNGGFGNIHARLLDCLGA